MVVVEVVEVVEVVVVEVVVDHQEAMVEKAPIKHGKEKRAAAETEGQESGDLNPSFLTMIE